MDLLFSPNAVTPDGKPYGLWLYKELVHQCYLISKNLNTSYSDALDITPLERGYLLEFLVEDAKEQKKQWDSKMEERKSRK